MSLQIKARHCTVDESLRTYVAQKVERISRFYAKVHQIEVVFTDEKKSITCEIEVVAPPLNVIGKADDKDIRASFDKAQKVVEGKLKREKSRMIDVKRQMGNNGNRPASPETPVEEVAALDELEAEFVEQLEEDPR